MNQWKNIAAVVALSLTTAVAGAGCVAQSDDGTNEAEITAGDQQIDQVADQTADESTGEAKQGWNGCFPFPRFLPFFGFVPIGCGVGFGGCFGGCGGCGFGC